MDSAGVSSFLNQDGIRCYLTRDEEHRSFTRDLGKSQAPRDYAFVRLCLGVSISRVPSAEKEAGHSGQKLRTVANHPETVRLKSRIRLYSDEPS